jgi:hypothetical protein
MIARPFEPPIPDIELPLRTRREDATEASYGEDASDPERGTIALAAPAGRVPLPFLASRLLCAEGPFGLDVEVKSSERIVGTWTLDVDTRHADGVRTSAARATLYVCASARGDVRATGAFLVLRQWSVPISDKAQLDSLYEALSVASLERLDSLLGGVPNATGEYRQCVLFLVDGRRLNRKLFSLDRLQIRILEDLESEHAIAGVDMRVAHGRGRGTQPHVVFATTLSAPLQSADSGLSSEPERADRALLTLHPPIGEVFVRETLSPENMRWSRRASDRLR